MGQRKYPVLSLSEVAAILTVLGFVRRRQDGSHAQYERPADSKRTRAIVTVDTAEREFGEFLIKSMIRQSGFDRNAFYGATKATAKKAGIALTVQPRGFI